MENSLKKAFSFNSLYEIHPEIEEIVHKGDIVSTFNSLYEILGWKRYSAGSLPKTSFNSLYEIQQIIKDLVRKRRYKLSILFMRFIPDRNHHSSFPFNNFLSILFMRFFHNHLSSEPLKIFFQFSL